jgi:hypothetical protein
LAAAAARSVNGGRGPEADAICASLVLMDHSHLGGIPIDCGQAVRTAAIA